MSKEKDFVPYNESLDLRDLGFDEPCQAIYHCMRFLFSYELLGKPYEWKKKELSNITNTICSDIDKDRLVTVPTFSQAFRFFRENYPDLDFAVGKINNGTNNYHYHINLLWDFFEGTYEQAELECLRKLIEICEKSK